MAGILNIIRSDRAYIGNASESLLGKLEAYTSAEASSVTLNRVIDWLESGMVAKDRLCNVYYSDFIVDAVAVVRQIYDYFAIDASEESYRAMVDYLTADRIASSKRAKHEYPRGTESQIARERQIYKRYRQYFNVRSEP